MKHYMWFLNTETKCMEVTVSFCVITVKTFARVDVCGQSKVLNSLNSWYKIRFTFARLPLNMNWSESGCNFCFPVFLKWKKE